MPCPCSCCKGACCNGGTCSQETCHDCEQAGGVYQGAGVACDGTGCPCDPPAEHLKCEKCLEGVVAAKCQPEDCCIDGLCQDCPPPICPEDPCDGTDCCVDGYCLPCPPYECPTSPCPSGECCVDGYCIPDCPEACDPACSPGECCIDGACVPCDACSPGECPEGECCVDGYCQECPPPPDEPCSPGSCPEGECCVNGYCLPCPPEECPDSACPSGECCVDGYCVNYCPSGEYCCGGQCQSEPCEDDPTGCCCVFAEDASLGWTLVSSTVTTEAACVAAAGQYAQWKAGSDCSGNPCVGDADGTCCTGGNCSFFCPGSLCVPTNAPGDDGCCCDSACYTGCFDCCGSDAIDCCTPSPVIASLWATPLAPGLVRISLAALERDMAEYGVDMDEAWGAAMQSGSGKDGYYVTQSYGLVSLALCLQEVSEGVAPWAAVMAHQHRVRAAASAIRAAA